MWGGKSRLRWTRWDEQEVRVASRDVEVEL